MPSTIFKSAIILSLALILPGAAQAQVLELSGNADCDGWSAMATLNFPVSVFYGDLDYSVVLTDQAGAEVTRFDWSGQVSRMEDTQIIRMFDDVWGLTLDSVYTANFAFQFLEEEASLSFEVVCGVGGGEEPEEPAVEPCRRTFRYWRKHPEEWPVDELVIGGELYTKDQLCRIMRFRMRLFPALSLARHLVAARLNVLNGTDDSIVPVMCDAEDFLIRYRDRHRVWWRHRGEARELRRALVQYNNEPCHTLELGTGPMQDDLYKTFADEPLSLDGVKAMYR